MQSEKNDWKCRIRKMGGNLALQAVEKGYEVVGHSRHFKDGKIQNV